MTSGRGQVSAHDRGLAIPRGLDGGLGHVAFLALPELYPVAADRDVGVLETHGRGAAGIERQQGPIKVEQLDAILAGLEG